MRIVVTGGCGFIGSALIRHLIGDLNHEILNIDKLTYAANPFALSALEDSPSYHFTQTDILDREAMEALFMEFQPDALYHLAAESHVDRSIGAPELFIETNVLGTQRMIDAVRSYLSKRNNMDHFRMIHVSTDEVFGDLPNDPTVKFTECTPYNPRSPYSASKAASDHLVKAAINTYGLPAIITNCSNNYGPFQNTEKLIPLIIKNALAGRDLPVYGAGLQIRDWLYVDDHVRGLVAAHQRGKIGSSYLFGGNNEMRNIDVVNFICRLLQDRSDCAGMLADGRRFVDLIHFVNDRPGHDFRYAIDASRARNDLGWKPEVGFVQGLASTVNWYADWFLSKEAVQ